MSPSISKQHGHIDSLMLISVLGLVGALAGIAYNFWQMSISDGWDEQYRAAASELRMATQEINVSSREAFSGEKDAFARLSSSSAEFPMHLAVLQRGRGSLPKPGSSMTRHVASIEKDWATVSESAEAILAGQERILLIRDVSRNLNTNIKTIQAHYADLVDNLGELDVSSSTLLAAQQQLWLIERIGRNLDRILAGAANAQVAAEEFRQDALLFQRNMEGLRQGDRLRDISLIRNANAVDTLNQATELYAQISESVNEIYDAHPELINAAQAASAIAQTTPFLSVNVGNAAVQVDQLADARPFSGITATYLGGLFVLFLALITVRMNGARAQERQAQEQASVTEDEVQQKVFEIQPLAEGNLTRDLTETDGITQPIAVAINQLIAWIREVVTSVKNSSSQVNEAVVESDQQPYVGARGNHGPGLRPGGGSRATGRRRRTNPDGERRGNPRITADGCQNQQATR